MVVALIEDNGIEVDTGFFGNWFLKTKKNLKLA
jgi:hypothetical protein